MADNNLNNVTQMTQKEQISAERAETLRADAKRIALQILDLTRNGLFVSLRFLDLALCQFDYINTEKIQGISTTGQHIVYNSQYVIRSYMKDRQALSRDYLHMVLHCIFRHPFVSENLDEEYWNLATDIAVETIIDELGLKQTATQNAQEISAEVTRIKKMVKTVTAEQLYQMFRSGSVREKDIELWRKLFYRDDHRIWWDIAEQIAEEMKRREEEEKANEEAEKNQSKQPPEEEAIEDEKSEDEKDREADEESETGEEDGEGDQESDQEDGEDSEAEEDSPQEGEEDDETSKDSDGDEEEDSGETPEEDGEEKGQEEENYDEDTYEDEYSSTPGQTLKRENPDDLADPDSDTQESGNEGSDDGTGGGKPDENDPQQSDQEGDSRPNDQSGEGLDGQDDHHKPEGKDNTADSLSGSTDEGQRDDMPGEDPFADGEQKQNSALSEGGSSSKNTAQQHGQKSAGTGGGGDGSQSAWQHDSGSANRRGDGERNENDRRQLQGDADPNSQQEISSTDEKLEEAVPTEASEESSPDEEKEASFMHNQSEQDELKDKWKDLSERILVDLQTSSKEWGDKSDTMLQGVKKINRDKYDYSTFLRKFATMREDIQINPEEFDYVYYTYGMQRYGNIPLIEPLEYKEVKKVRDFVIAIDTSGSCAGEVVQKFLDKTYSLFTQQENFFKKINLHIIQCDAQIQSDVKITNRQEFDDYVRDLEFTGFGGTDFRPVFEYVNELLEQNEFDDLKGLIYFTDGNGTYPKKRPPYETAFVFVDDDEFEYEVPSWAMKLVLETSDIMQEVLI